MQSMDGCWESVGDDSLLAPVFNMRLQKWLYPKVKTSWHGFFRELQEIVGEKTFFIQFVGTEEDFEDISTEAKRFNGDGMHTVSVEAASDLEYVPLGSAKTLRSVCDIIRNARHEEYYKMIPEQIRHFLETSFLTTETTVQTVDVRSLKEEDLSQILGPACWDMVLFHFNLDEIDDRRMRENIFTISNRMKLLDRYEKERFAFICITDDRQINASLAEQQAKDFLREMGIPEDFDLVLKSDGVSSYSIKNCNEKDDVTRIIDTFSKRYANPIRLQKSRQYLVRLLHANGMEKQRSPFVECYVSDHVLDEERIDVTTVNEIDRFCNRLQTWDATVELEDIVKESSGCFIIALNRVLKTMDIPETSIPLSLDDMELLKKRVCGILTECLVNGAKHFGECVEENAWFKECKWFDAAIKTTEDVSNEGDSQGFLRTCVTDERYWDDGLAELCDCIQYLYKKNVSVDELLQLLSCQAMKMYGGWLSERKAAILQDFDSFKARLKRKCNGSISQPARGIQQDARNIEDAAKWLQDIVAHMNKCLDF